MSFIYIASPYTHADPAVMEERYQMAMEFTAYCMKNSEVVYSPIVHCHVMAQVYKLPTNWAFWRMFDLRMIKKAKEIRVMMLPGWKESVGVTAEIEFAETMEIPVTYVYKSDALGTWRVLLESN